MKKTIEITSDLTEMNAFFTETVNTYYKSIYDFILKEGELLNSQKLTAEELSIVKKALKKSKKTKSGLCFYNSQCLVLSDETNSIEYWEGFRLNSYTHLHGFNIINGKIIDITKITFENQIFGEFKDDIQYMGVKFDKKMIYDRILSGKNCTTFIDNWEEGYPLLKTKWKK